MICNSISICRVSDTGNNSSVPERLYTQRQVLVSYCGSHHLQMGTHTTAFISASSLTVFLKLRSAWQALTARVDGNTPAHITGILAICVSSTSGCHSCVPLTHLVTRLYW